MTRLLKRLRASAKGTSAIEFAFVAPTLLLMYLGGFQLMDAVSAYRKMTTTTRAIADLTSQFTSVYDDDLDVILAASEQIMRPYDSAPGAYRVSLITVDASSNAKVTWSRGLRMAALTEGAAYALPNNLKRPGMVYVVSDVTYTYRPTVAGYMMGDLPLRDQIFMMPRGSATITRKT